MDSQIPSSSKHNEQSIEPPKKRLKHDEKIHSSLSSRLEFSPPKIVEYSSVNEYCDKLQNSVSYKAINQTRDNLTQIQKRGKSVSLSKFDSSNKPHFPMSVEELSVVTSVDNWTNTNIRVCGVVVEKECNHYLESIDEDGGPFKILLDLNCFYRIPPLYRTIQIFGELLIVSLKPVLRVFFYRDYTKVNFCLHRKAEEIFKSFVPTFVNKERSDSMYQMNDTLDDFEKDHSSLFAIVEFSPPNIVGHSSISGKLKNSADLNKMLNQTCDNLTQTQTKVKSVPSSEIDNTQKPHFPISVKELSIVTCIDNWTNTYVRVCGIVKQDEYNLNYYLESIEEDGGPFTILLDLNCFYRIPSLNTTLQIFGEIVIVSNNPVLTVFFYRDFSKINFSLFRKTEENFKSFVPMFVGKENSNSTCQLNDTLDDCDFGHLLD